MNKKIIDVSRGKRGINHVSVSPDGRLLAFTYLSNSALHIANIYQGDVTFLAVSEKMFEDAKSPSTSNETLSICDWSKISWNLESNKLAFYSCSNSYSIATWWDYNFPAQLPVIPNSSSSNKGMRVIDWQGNSIIYSVRSHNGTNLFSVDIANTHNSSLVYGPGLEMQ